MSGILIGVPLWNGNLAHLIESHAGAMSGVPWSCAVAASVVVTSLRSSFGSIEFKVLDVELKGASGPIVLWLLCFLIQSLGIEYGIDRLRRCEMPIPTPVSPWKRSPFDRDGRSCRAPWA